MSVIQQADALLGIFGYSRVQCSTCTHSIGTEAPLLLCSHRQVMVDRDAQCKSYERDPGEEGDE